MNELKSELHNYDLLVTDFEPITAWAARLAGIPTIGIGHQYAFGSGTPVWGGNWISHRILEYFAPVSLPVGLHWHRYRQNILPPILDLPDLDDHRDDYILVYLPFEAPYELITWLQQFPLQQFKVYGTHLGLEQHHNVQCFTPSIEGFKYHLRDARGVICNSGFELISECLQWRKPVLSKPLTGQMEQLSNAAALEELGYATIIRSLSHDALGSWLHTRNTTPNLHFPDVAAMLAQWLAGNCQADLKDLGQTLWDQVDEADFSSNLRTRSSTATPAPVRLAEYSGTLPLNRTARSQSSHSSAP